MKMKNKSLFDKGFYLAIIAIVAIVTLAIAPSFSEETNKTKTNYYGYPITNNNYSNTPTNQPPITFSNGESINDIATNYMGAIATVNIVSADTTELVGWGSGVAISDGGYLVTNYHVISKVVTYVKTGTQEPAYKILLHMLYNNELVYDVPAEVVWFNSFLDIAVLKSNQNFQSYVAISDRWINPETNNRLSLGETVWTLGTPAENALFGTFSKGSISSIYNRVCATEVENEKYVHNYFIQHSAPISNGNSGGGLFDEHGKLIGLNTCGITSTNTVDANDLYFALPIYPITRILNRIIDGQKSGIKFETPILGITKAYDKFYKDYVAGVTFDKDGFYIEEIGTGCARNAGLRKGDIIIGIGNANCTGEDDESYKIVNTRYDYLYAILEYNPGDTIKLYYKHRNQINNVTIVLVGSGL